MPHALWCPAHVTEADRETGRDAGKCECRSGTPRCPKTADLFIEPPGMSVEQFLEEDPEKARRDLDLKLLAELVDAFFQDEPEDRTVCLATSEHEAFESMLIRLRRGQVLLTEKQRKWVEGRASDLNLASYSPAARNANVPRGREVQLAIDGMPKPKKPPGRR